ncbi:MAG: alpha/beta fold hydrolase [Sandaracinaceae bacterium]|nr:alpha/beta fold hydrolase [Sandaracinaceae bacterium]
MSIVFLHGFTGGPTSWDAVLGHLLSGPCAAERKLCPVITGHEGSVTGPRDAWPAQPHSFEAEVDRLAALLPRGTLHLVGYSLGARLALGLLVRHRVRFETATLIGGHPGLDDAAARTARVEADDALAARLEQAGLPAFVKEWEALPLWESQRTLAPARLAAQRALRLTHDAPRLAHALRTLSLGRMPSWTSALPTLDLPVTLVAGHGDSKFRALAEGMAAALPSARLEVLGDAGAPFGHNLLLEAPGDLARVIVETVDV